MSCDYLQLYCQYSLDITQGLFFFFLLTFQFKPNKNSEQLRWFSTLILVMNLDLSM